MSDGPFGALWCVCLSFLALIGASFFSPETAAAQSTPFEFEARQTFPLADRVNGSF